ncbi:endonuclease/exonuclease/phosphatase family protein [Marininema halotolerans]|uniref:Endonuclease/Exonuclease/phosphatase family protein n=1 Tax=Marininema halotolerans TaxID=1155944 RepID=A0A1I6UUT3_9BACL|nr:endonuclease/exonuclease/phosphatase family protein [Marininema halotolerans]SFT05252.1 Endonuclease/Exonuclease/phosphatase family protein [Marininema halotolerans]
MAITNRPLKVITWNVYEGAALLPLITRNQNAVRQRTVRVFRQFLATDFNARATSMSKIFQRLQPDIIGLQEMSIWTLTPPPGSRAPSVTYNFLTILQEKLRAAGLNYRVVARNNNYSDTLPGATGYTYGLSDFDVILARSDFSGTFSSIQQRNFNVNDTYIVGGRPFSLVLGWSSVNVTFAGGTFRIVNTHLPPIDPRIRTANTTELLRGPLNTSLPTLLMGFFNLNANNNTLNYRRFINAGFTDAWTANRRIPGNDCCRDTDLLNVSPRLTRRDALFLYRNGFTSNRIFRLGVSQRSRTPGALWPSRYAGLYATFQ